MKLLDLLHRWTGGLIGLVLAVLGVSGALLAHKHVWVMLPHVGDAQVQATGTVADAVQRVMVDPETRPQMITFATRDFGLNRLKFGEGAGAYTDQAGNMVEHWNSQWERPEIWLFDLHHHLFAGDAGETIGGIAAIAGMFFVVSGVILWWRTRKAFEFRLLPKRWSRPAVLRHHRDLGVVVAPLLFLSLLTGAILVFRPITALLLGPSAPALIDASLKAPKPRPARLAERLDWRGMIATARTHFPEAELRSLSLPRNDNGLITLRMRKHEEWLPNGRTTLWFAADTGRLVAMRDASRLPATVKIYNMLYPLHAATVGGLTYRLAMTVSGLALGLLGSLTVWTFWFPRKRTKASSAIIRLQNMSLPRVE